MVYVKWNSMQPIKMFYDIGKYSLLSEKKRLSLWSNESKWGCTVRSNLIKTKIEKKWDWE